jgi:hypothetical protein
MPTKADPPPDARTPVTLLRKFGEAVHRLHNLTPAPAPSKPACDECIRLRAELLFLAAAVDSLADLPPGLRARCKRIIDRREG